MRFFKEFRSIGTLFALLTFALILITGCGGSGSSDSEPAPVPKNLTATSVKILDADGIPDAQPLLMVEHPFIVEMGIASTTAIEGVAVDFFIIGKADFDDAGDEAVNDDTALEDSIFFVGTTYLENLKAGLNTRQVELSLPFTEWMEQTEVVDEEEVVNTVYTRRFPIPDTGYYLVGVIDPGDLIEETDEEDNRPSEGNKDQTMVIVQVSSEYKVTPNLILEEIVVEVPNFELKSSDPVDPEVDSCGQIVPVEEEENNPHVKVTAIINASGKYWPEFYSDPESAPKPIPRVELQVWLKTPGIPSIPFDVPVLIWNTDSTEPTYEETLIIEDLEPGTPMSVSLELRFPGTEGALESLIDQIASQSAACFEANCDLDEACFAEEMIAGTNCDVEDLADCGGSVVDPNPQNPVIDYPDWGCYMNRIDSQCLNQCNPELDCILACTESLASLEFRITAYDENGGEVEIGEDLVIANQLEKELVLLPAPEPPSTGAVMFETGYDKGFSAKLAYAGLNANVWAGLDTGGASAGLEAALPVVLFKGAPSPCNPLTQDCPFGYKPSEVFLGVRSAIGAFPDEVMENMFENLATVDIYVFGQNLFPKALDFGCGVEEADLTLWNKGGLDCALGCPGVVPNETPQQKQERINCLKECWAFGKSTSFTKNFVVGVVPLTASFSAWGLIGAEISMGIDQIACGVPLRFEAHTGPWANLGTEVTAGVGAGALSAGVGGALDPLLEDTFFATVAVELSSDGDGVAGLLHEDITNTLTGPQGKVFFYVRYPCIKWCKKWGIPYPCGLKACQAKKNIVGFTTFKREDVLFCDEQVFIE